MRDAFYTYKDFHYDSAADEDPGEVTKFMHYVFWNEEFVGMVPHSSYSICPKQKFVDWCIEFLTKKEVERW